MRVVPESISELKCLGFLFDFSPLFHPRHGHDGGVKLSFHSRILRPGIATEAKPTLVLPAGRLT
jgi:hypothetical protein